MTEKVQRKRRTPGLCEQTEYIYPPTERGACGTRLVLLYLNNTYAGGNYKAIGTYCKGCGHVIIDDGYKNGHD